MLAAHDILSFDARAFLWNHRWGVFRPRASVLPPAAWSDSGRWWWHPADSCPCPWVLRPACHGGHIFL